MRIVYLVTRLDEIGGAQIHVRDMAIAMHQAGHSVSVISGTDGATATILRELAITVHIVPELQRQISPLRDAVAIQKVRGILKTIKPDLLSCHSTKAGIIGRVAAAFCCPALFTAHGYVFTDGIPWRARLFYWLVELCMRPLTIHTITVCESDRRLAIKTLISNSRRVTTIYNGMPDIALKPAEISATNTACHVVMIARFCRQKDHESLLTALGALQHLNWQLTLIGGGKSERYQNQARHLGIDQRITFAGEIDSTSVAATLQTADIFVLTTNWEGLPRSIIEALRSGLPVVATRVAGIPEMVQDGHNGFLVGRGDTAAIAAALHNLMKDTALRQTMGAASRARYLQQFTFNGMLQKTLALYDRVLTQKPAL